MAPQRILVIKLSALGDFVQASGPMKAIHAAHPDAHITLLTTGPYVAMGQATGWFDEVWSDGRPDWSDLPAVWRLLSRLRGARFDRVYDLQTQSRTIRYFQLLWPRRPDWSGNAPGAKFRYAGPERDRLHIQDSQRNQLAVAGIPQTPPPDVSWLKGEGGFDLQSPYALLVPGGAPHRPAKRWPAERYGELAARLAREGITPVVLGHGPDEAGLAEIIRASEPSAVVLVGKTKLGDIADLARAAALAVGNDTGPMHVIAAGGCPSLVLFSADSDPALSAPRPSGEGRVEILREMDLEDLAVAPVWSVVETLRNR
ncbi:ADP-heptose:LPS heptosyltransferase [Caulobacter ginsengisoli]|uniref:ADP-heptose:LPS heptosyltransferase n=1 Tax=Caulobacter ginsengisoli TaxID=400775 RepID=A0ABU0IRP5_9CAUL|nr:glycosyltransferase family 9 protein [Caulobacter ginsengisoli]MDQ0463607.1 ADP-heptose:LPS heptosyltransferase [Caulobacter ginsengisoli]